MAITRQVQSQITEQREQTWRINFELPAGGAPSIQVYRETVGLDAEGNPVGKPQQNYTPVNRAFEAVQEESVTFDDGTEISFADIVEALSEFGDRWAQEDADKPATQPGMPPPAPEPEPEPKPEPKQQGKSRRKE
jgi:hypothetical protein